MRPRWLVRLLGPVLILIVLSGCADDTSAGEAPATTSAPATPTPTPAESPTEPPPPSVMPATGKTYDLPALSLTMPRQFRPVGPGVGNGLLSVTQFATKDVNGFLSVGALANLASGDLDAAADLALKNSDQTLTRLPDRDVGGQQVYAVQGSSPDTALFYTVGRIVDDRIVDLTFYYRTDDGTAQQEIDSILATVQWKE